MSNHGFVKTRKFMSVEKIDQMLVELNQRVFRGNLQIERFDGNEWLVSYYSGGREYASRAFWLNTSRSWEIRHSGGNGDFAHWLDCVLTNEISVRFDGNITDEGISERWKGKPRKNDDFLVFLRRMKEGPVKDEKLLTTALMQLEMKYVPPEFQVDLGPEIDIMTFMVEELERVKGSTKPP